MGVIILPVSLKHPRWYREEVLPELEEDLENEAKGKKVKAKALFKGING